MEIISFLIGVIGTALSALGIFLTIRSNKATRKSKTIDWGQLQTASKYLCKKIKKKDFTPQIIITPGQKGGIISQLIIDYLDIQIPIYCGYLLSKENPINESLSQNYILIETTKWYVYLPKCLENSTSYNILIVDDFVMSGDFLHKLLERLHQYGYEDESIISCSVATTSVAIKTNKQPTFYWKVIDAEDSYFPWGKAK